MLEVRLLSGTFGFLRVASVLSGGAAQALRTTLNSVGEQVLAQGLAGWPPWLVQRQALNLILFALVKHFRWLGHAHSCQDAHSEAKQGGLHCALIEAKLCLRATALHNNKHARCINRLFRRLIARKVL
eukprot:3203433-Amphidinium_carterae.1